MMQVIGAGPDVVTFSRPGARPSSASTVAWSMPQSSAACTTGWAAASSPPSTAAVSMFSIPPGTDSIAQFATLGATPAEVSSSKRIPPTSPVGRSVPNVDGSITGPSGTVSPGTVVGGKVVGGVVVVVVGNGTASYVISSASPVLVSASA